MICIVRVILFLVLSSASAALASPVLVYRDTGVCPEKCSEAIGDLAAKEFGSVKYVKASQITAANLKTAKIWIQPGGDAIEVAQKMTAQQKELLRDFVANGGAYLGICAGAFFADHFADDYNKVPGLGLIPGVSFDAIPGSFEDRIVQVFWGSNTPRDIYFQAGATFKLDYSRPTVVLARYLNNEPAAIQFRYGKGVVVLAGPHPEAPLYWKVDSNLIDNDGDDFDLAKDLLDRVGWYAGLTRQPLTR